MIDVRSVGLCDELQHLAAGADRTPFQGRRNLRHRDFLRSWRIVAQDDFAANAKAMLSGFDTNIQVVMGNSEGFAIESKCVHHRGTEDTEKRKTQKQLHFLPEDACLFCAPPCAATLLRRCRTISYITTAPATETFSDGTFPSIGIETRKSHFLFTRSCSPLPSAPRTRAQSML